MPEISDNKALRLQALVRRIKQFGKLSPHACPEWTQNLEETLGHLTIKNLDNLDFLFGCMLEKAAHNELPK